MKHIGLFEGIGGFSLAARWMGWETVAWCEWDEFCQRVLKYHFPNADAHGDITKTDFTGYAGQIDILTGGFPCQPYSSAGKRLGKEDDRHLWPEMLRAIREIQPRWVVGENVRGLTNWNGGVVFDEVQADLENEGYEVTPYLLPACAVNAPHRRDRIWFVAYNTNKKQFCSEPGVWQRPNYESERVCNTSFNTKQVSNGGHNGRASKGEGLDMERNGMVSGGWEQGSDNFRPSNYDAANAKPKGLEGEDGGRMGKSIKPSQYTTTNTDEIGSNRAAQHENGCKDRGNREQSSDANDDGKIWKSTSNPGEERHERSKQFGEFEPGGGREQPPGPTTQLYQIGNWQHFPTQPPVCGGDDGISRRLDGITFPKWREKSIGAYGNAIVPQVALQIFKAIQESEK